MQQIDQSSGEQGPGSEKYTVRADPDIEDLVPIFLAELQEDLAATKAALDRSDFATVRALGHKSRGTAAGYGFDQVSELCFSLETAGGAGHHGEAQRILQQIDHYLERVVIVYQ